MLSRKIFVFCAYVIFTNFEKKKKKKITVLAHTYCTWGLQKYLHKPRQCHKHLFCTHKFMFKKVKFKSLIITSPVIHDIN